MENMIRQEVNGFVRELVLVPPFDKRHSNPSEDYGVHGMDLKMYLTKGKRCIQFIVFLPVYLPQVVESMISGSLHSPSKYSFKGMGASVGYHSPTPLYEGQRISVTDCPFTGGDCYHNESYLRAEAYYRVFLEKGVDRIWQMLEKEYRTMFEHDGNESFKEDLGD